MMMMMMMVVVLHCTVFMVRCRLHLDRKNEKNDVDISGIVCCYIHTFTQRGTDSHFRLMLYLEGSSFVGGFGWHFLDCSGNKCKQGENFLDHANEIGTRITNDYSRLQNFNSFDIVVASQGQSFRFMQRCECLPLI